MSDELKELADVRKVSYKLLLSNYKRTSRQLRITEKELEQLGTRSRREKETQTTIDCERHKEKNALTEQMMDKYRKEITEHKKEYSDLLKHLKDVQILLQTQKGKQSGPELHKNVLESELDAVQLRCKELVKMETEHKATVHSLEAKVKELTTSNSLKQREMQSRSTALGMAEKMLIETKREKQHLESDNKRLIEILNESTRKEHKSLFKNPFKKQQ